MPGAVIVPGAGGRTGLNTDRKGVGIRIRVCQVQIFSFFEFQFQFIKLFFALQGRGAVDMELDDFTILGVLVRTSVSVRNSIIIPAGVQLVKYSRQRGARSRFYL